MESFHFVDYETNNLINTFITNVENRMKEKGGADWTLYPGDERRIFIECLIPEVQAMFATADRACLNRFLDTAYGTYLDVIGSHWGCARLEPKKSECVVRFFVQKPRTVTTQIPKGTRVTSDNVYLFETKEFATIPIGEEFVDIEVIATAGGLSGNNYEIGDLTSIIDTVPYISGVTNTTKPDGGDDGEPYPESGSSDGDDRYRERIKLIRATYSTCGASGAYEYFAKTANSTVKNVKVVIPDVNIKTAYYGDAFTSRNIFSERNVESGIANAEKDDVYINTTSFDVYRCMVGGAPDVAEWCYVINLSKALSAGNVNIYATTSGEIQADNISAKSYDGGCIPTPQVLSDILEMCSAKDKRPLGDYVSVFAPELVEYDIELKYYTDIDSEQNVVESIEGKNGAIKKYIEWQCAEIGKHINPSKLEALCMHPNWEDGMTGALRVEVTKPVHRDLEETQLARWSGEIKISHDVVTGY